MNPKVEGTLILDGLVEGKIPARPGAAHDLQDWVRTPLAQRFAFSLELDGNNFSAMPETKSVPVAPLGEEPSEAVAAALGTLLETLPPDHRAAVLSTLRSVEYRRGQEIQTLYAVGPDGSVHLRQRTVETETTPPPTPMTGRQKLLLAGKGVLVALVVLAVTSIFVDYRAMVGRLIDSIRGYKADELKVDASAFADYFTVQKKAVASGGEQVVLTLRRSEKFPLDDAACAALIAAGSPAATGRPVAGQRARQRTRRNQRTCGRDHAPRHQRARRPAGAMDTAAGGKALADRLAVEALARGYVLCESFDAKGQYLGVTLQRISPLRDKPEIDLFVPLPRDPRSARIVLRP